MNELPRRTITYTGNPTIRYILSKNELISDQVSKIEIEIILTYLDKALQNTSHGDIVEFGCYSGTTSLFIQRYLTTMKQSRKFHVYDSFEGLPEKTSQDSSPAGEQFVTGELRYSKKDFIQNFKKANLPPPIIHKGWFENISRDDLPNKIAFAFLDGDYYLSIKQSLELIEPRLVQGAIIVVDDYQSEALPGARKATDQWLNKHLSFSIQTSHSLGIICDGREDRR